MSDGTSVTSPPPSPAVVTTTYKLAEHRYGREEMLALFAETREVPEELKEVPIIVSEKPLQPLALIPLSSDEQVSNSGFSVCFVNEACHINFNTVAVFC